MRRIPRQGCAGMTDTLAGFTVAFFTHGEHLVPMVRDILNPPGTLIRGLGSRLVSARH
jgi:hypothetical protein